MPTEKQAVHCWDCPDILTKTSKAHFSETALQILGETICIYKLYKIDAAAAVCFAQLS